MKNIYEKQNLRKINFITDNIIIIYNFVHKTCLSFISGIIKSDKNTLPYYLYQIVQKHILEFLYHLH